MPALLTLIAHASTQAVRDAAFPQDEPIDAAGQAKAAVLASALRRVDAAWTSPALRARQTATALQLDPIVEPALRDIDCGHWAGRSFDAVQEAEPASVTAWLTDPAAAPHGGESVVGLLDRVAPWLASPGLAQGRTVAVTHAAVIRAAILLALAAPPASFWRIDVAPLCRVRLRGDHGRWTLLGMA